MVNTSPIIGRSGKRRQLIVALPQDLKMKLFKIAAFPSANLISPVPVVFTFTLLVPLSTAIFSKQCRVMTTNGYDIVNIIQMSIILIYPVVLGRDWDIPMKYVVNPKSKVALTSMTISR